MRRTRRSWTLLLAAGLTAPLVWAGGGAWAQQAAPVASKTSAPAKEAERLQVSVSGDLLTVRFKDVELSEALEAISRASGVRIRMDKGAKKRITLSFRDMPFDKGIRNVIRPLDHAMVWSSRKTPDGRTVDVLQELDVFRQGYQGGATVEFAPEPGEEGGKSKVAKEQWDPERRKRMLEKLKVKPSL